jgi:hypothetical protein
MRMKERSTVHDSKGTKRGHNTTVLISNGLRRILIYLVRST